ncbi:hypothetical protein BS78_K012300 [Paspalum vaginatum]|uniref:Disease resistance R13L4/SHOC-2-like LRR domain-containing protein n=1 Tax=Paspalum vaginatum TaxID=158149 RepID=A0A9W8CF44_9POAL|nr:hypothetical protein BS78_K012300 [Paspalum vaginatum]
MGKQLASPYRNRWLISTLSKDVCDRSRRFRGTLGWEHHLRPEYYHALPFDDDNTSQREWAMLIKEALLDAAGSIHNALQQRGRGVGDSFGMHVALQCLYYGVLYHPLKGAEAAAGVHHASITSNELVRCWVADDLLPGNTTADANVSHYRSAYEAGKVVIQALQEYSLLPIYSAASTPTSSGTSWTTTTTSSASSSQDATTGVSKLAEGIPRLQQHQLGPQRWVSFMNDDGRHIRCDFWSQRWNISTLTTLILRAYSNISGFPFDQVLYHHKYLRVLDMSYTPMNSLPSCISLLSNLHLLSLRGCFQLQTLSSSPQPAASTEETRPLANLGYLQVLDMCGVPLLELTPQDGCNKSNLHYLDLSGSRITTLPSEFFHDMSRLEELILGCSCLKELPPSLAKLSNLLVLDVEGTMVTSFPGDTFEALQRLHTLKLINNMLLLSLPMSLSNAKGLKELHIYNCISLRLQSLWELVSCLEDLYIQTWEALQDINIHGHPNLRTVTLSGQWIRCLSLRGCSKLKTVQFSDDLTALEDVDLSGTALEEVPHNLPNLPKLRTLLLLNVPCLKRFPWHKMDRFPKMFFLDNCTNEHNQLLEILCKQDICTDGNQDSEKTNNIAQININNSSIFYSFNNDAANKLVREGHFLKSFSVKVKSCSARGKETQKKGGARIKTPPPYHDVHSDEASCIPPMMKLQPKQRHLVISSNSQYPNGLRNLLSVTNSMLVTDDAFVRCLTDLNYNLMSLEECQLQHCHQMIVVFILHWCHSEALPNLQILQASFLNNLLCLVKPSRPLSMFHKFNLLKYIHLEHCPRLEIIFPCCLSLPALETLIILFCSNLKTIFYKHTYVATNYPIPNIKTIYLQELPQLQHFHDDVTFRFETPKWETLFVRGCRSFQRLPLLQKKYPKSPVEVSGERDWWGKLQWSLPQQTKHYFHVPPPQFTSCKKHIIKSYLR